MIFRKTTKVILTIFIVALSAYFISELIQLYSHRLRTNQLESIRNDYLNHQYVFEQTVKLFPEDGFNRISLQDYDKNNEALAIIFEDLKYIDIYSHKGNVYFNKFGDGLSFDGMVYLRNPSYVVGIIKTQTIYLDNSGKWISYYSHGL